MQFNITKLGWYMHQSSINASTKKHMHSAIFMQHVNPAFCKENKDLKTWSLFQEVQMYAEEYILNTADGPHLCSS